MISILTPEVFENEVDKALARFLERILLIGKIAVIILAKIVMLNDIIIDWKSVWKLTFEPDIFLKIYENAFNIGYCRQMQ